MKANLPPSPSNPNPEPGATVPVPPAATKRSSRNLVILAAAIAIGCAGVWWYFQRGETLPDPPLPAGIQDAEVKRVVEKAREKVLADPRSGEAWGDYAMVLLANLFDRDATACFVQASKLNPTDPRWPYGRALIALKRDPDNAPIFLREAIATGGSLEYVSAARLTLAETLLERLEFDAAAELFRQEGGNPRAVFGLGLVALARGDDAAATREFLAVRNDIHVRKQATAQLAILARRQGDLTAARRLEDEANLLQADPPWPDPIHDRALDLQVGRRGRERRIEILELQGRDYDALQEHLQLLTEERTSKALVGAAVNWARLGNQDEAVKLLREAVKLDPTDSKAAYTLALVLFTPARQELEKNPNSAAAKERLREAADYAKRATELKPDNSEAYLFWGMSLRYLDQPAEAIEPLRKGLVIRPDNFDLYFRLGEVLAATGDKAGAASAFENALKIRPGEPRAGAALAAVKGK